MRDNYGLEVTHTQIPRPRVTPEPRSNPTPQRQRHLRKSSPEAGDRATTIDREQLRALLRAEQPIRLIMVQGPGRFHAAHIPGSETFASLEEALRELDIDDRIVVYCSGGHASVQALRWLQGQGYRNVRRYPGGLADWHAAGLPLAGDNRLRACSPLRRTSGSPK